jgi:hypothetical protein
VSSYYLRAGIVTNYFSSVFERAIAQKAMPILPFQQATQEWIKSHMANNASSKMSSFHPDFYEYQEFIKFYVKINLNHFGCMLLFCLTSSSFLSRDSFFCLPNSLGRFGTLSRRGRRIPIDEQRSEQS